MFDIPDKVDGSTTLPAAEFNSLKNELKHIIEVFLAIGGDDFQIARSVSTHVAVADFYTDGGIADAYALTRPVTNVQLPPAFLDGMRVRFFALATNTGGVGGVTVEMTGIPDSPKSIKQFDGSVLPANAIVEGEMTELVFLPAPKDFFVVSSSSDTRAITADTTLTVAPSGANFTTLAAAYGSLRDQYISDNATVTIEILSAISEVAPLQFTHSEGARINIQGAPAETVNIDGVNSVIGSAGSYSIEYVISAAFINAVLGDYVFIYDTVAGGPNVLKFYNKKHEGLWQISALTVNTITVTNKFDLGAPDTPNTNDIAAIPAAGKITFLPAQITYTADVNFFVNGANLGGLLDVIIINNVASVVPAFLSVGSRINVANSANNFFFGVVAQGRPAIQMDLSEMFGNVRIAAIATGGGGNELNFLLRECQFRRTTLLLSNAGEGSRNFVAEGCNIVARELVVCGSNGATLTSNTVGFEGGFARIDSIFIIANKVMGLRVLGGVFETTDFIIITDNGGGLEVWASGNITSLSGINIVRIQDNNRAGGTARVGVRVINGSSLMLGADEAGGKLNIAEITITGNTTQDIQVRLAGSVGVFATSGLIGKASANNVASIIHNVTITTDTPDAGTAGIITFEA